MRVKTKYTGVIYRECLTNGKKDKTYYIRYTDKSGKDKELKVGKFSEGIRENYCNQKRNEIITKERLGEAPPALLKNTKQNFCSIETIALDYFKNRKEGRSKDNDFSIYEII